MTAMPLILSSALCTSAASGLEVSYRGFAWSAVFIFVRPTETSTGLTQFLCSWHILTEVDEESKIGVP